MTLKKQKEDELTVTGDDMVEMGIQLGGVSGQDIGPQGNILLVNGWRTESKAAKPRNIRIRKNSHKAFNVVRGTV